MNDSDLDRQLRTWTAPQVPADSFRRGVWQRIAQHEASAPRWLRWLDALLRPRVAIAGFAIVLAAGAGGGLLHASHQLKSITLASADATGAYVQSINPLDPVHLAHAQDMR